MSIFLWLFQFISPIAIILGGLYLLEDPSTASLVVGAMSAVLGLVVGIVGWGDTVPPRWFFLALAIFGLVEYFG